ncbi:hypothetical protein DENIS_3493 [Desulfonema ishimotonii]|uniref:Ryanodine receptor Ryr domain-containing protein n=2 Tax=Desulfonema ishimotonii TaxID=45657 RepID=A0A401FZX3_9BACT|nr:hypothetical protein DENIS_3493 [Desulfonema ishimotonii]
MKKITVEQAARSFHQHLKAFRESLGDYTLPDWEETTKHNREMGVRFVRYTLANQSITPESHHEKWVANMAKRGWRHGNERNPDKKTHPCMVPWEDLPYHEQAKTVLMIATVNILRPMICDDEEDDEGATAEGGAEEPQSPRPNGNYNSLGRMNVKHMYVTNFM